MKKNMDISRSKKKTSKIKKVSKGKKTEAESFNLSMIKKAVEVENRNDNFHILDSTPEFIVLGKNLKLSVKRVVSSVNTPNVFQPYEMIEEKEYFVSSVFEWSNKGVVSPNREHLDFLKRLGMPVIRASSPEDLEYFMEKE